MSGSKRRKDCLKTGENKKYLETVETDMCQLEGVWVPFGRRVGEYTFRNIYTCIGYIQPTIGGYMSFKSIYLGIWVEECMFCNILYLCCQQFIFVYFNLGISYLVS